MIEEMGGGSGGAEKQVSPGCILKVSRQDLLPEGLSVRCEMKR